MKTIEFDDKTPPPADAGAPDAAEARVSFALLGAPRGARGRSVFRKLLKFALLTCLALPIQVGIFSLCILLGAPFSEGEGRAPGVRLDGKVRALLGSLPVV